MSAECSTFMGLTPAEIAELKARADKLDAMDLIREIVDLKTKLAAYDLAVARLLLVRKATA